MNQIDLGNQVAVVTGGAQGLGFAIAQRLLTSGAKVSLWDMNADALAAAVVFDTDQLLAAVLRGDDDARRAGIDGVLNQFFDHRGRALDDLASRDLVGEVNGQTGNPSHLPPA